jgi:hypothetical protein
MNSFILFAHPWWVNLLVIVPIVSYFAFRSGLVISKMQLFIAAIFGIAFGFVEAAVVVYLRAASGLFPQSATIYQPSLVLNSVARGLLTIEFFRNAATIIMLVSVALLAAKNSKERWALFLWVFAFWDIFYYVGLWFTTRWPNSLTTPDVLFLIPVPWTSQVWFPYLVSLACLLGVVVNRSSGK